jgi:hypothetical protein
MSDAVDDLAIREKIYREAKDCIVISREVQQWSNHGEIDFYEIRAKLEAISGICWQLCGDIQDYEVELGRDDQ